MTSPARPAPIMITGFLGWVAVGIVLLLTPGGLGGDEEGIVFFGRNRDITNVKEARGERKEKKQKGKRKEEREEKEKTEEARVPES